MTYFTPGTVSATLAAVTINIGSVTLPVRVTSLSFSPLDNTGKKRWLLPAEGNRVKHRSKNLPQWAKAAIPPQFTRVRDLAR